VIVKPGPSAAVSRPRRAAAARHLLVRLRETEAATEVRWVEVFNHAVQLHVTPLSSAELFRRRADVLVANIHQQGLYPGTGAMAAA